MRATSIPISASSSNNPRRHALIRASGSAGSVKLFGAVSTAKETINRPEIKPGLPAAAHSREGGKANHQGHEGRQATTPTPLIPVQTGIQAFLVGAPVIAAMMAVGMQVRKG